MNAHFPALRAAQRFTWRAGVAEAGARDLAEECAVALVFAAGTEAVMMATPADFEDFARGFALSEGVVDHADDIESIDIFWESLGVEIRVALAEASRTRLAQRRRLRMGPVGCGLCGVESLEAALAPVPRVAAQITIAPEDLIAAMAEMSALQALNRRTHAVHAAGFYVPGEGVVLVREDVGRHNALDKLIGALAAQGRSAGDGAILLSSRLSLDLVQKAARVGAPMIAAVSAPTALALRTAEAAQIAVAAVVRADGLEIYTYPERFGVDVQSRVHAD